MLQNHLGTHPILDCGNDPEKVRLKVGEWLRIKVEQSFYYYKVADINSYPIVKLSARLVAASPECKGTGAEEIYSAVSKSSVAEKGEFVKVQWSQFDVNFDSLHDTQKQDAIVQMIDMLPPVHNMKKWLEEKTTIGGGVSLNRWSDIIPAACGILRWIIASNRSCIVPVDDIDESGNRTANEDRVWGMQQWTQFRFVMGAPDKEQRFLTAVKNAERRLNLQCKFSVYVDVGWGIR